MIVSAPNYGETGSLQMGMVYLINASLVDDAHGITETRVDLNTACYQQLRGSERMAKFGWSVAVVDLNKDGISDLAISAPSAGQWVLSTLLVGFSLLR